MLGRGPIGCLSSLRKLKTLSLSLIPLPTFALYSAHFLQRIISKKKPFFSAFFLDNSARNGHPSACAKRRGRSIGRVRKLGENPCCRRKESTKEKSDGRKTFGSPTTPLSFLRYFGTRGKGGKCV